MNTATVTDWLHQKRLSYRVLLRGGLLGIEHASQFDSTASQSHVDRVRHLFTCANAAEMARRATRARLARIAEAQRRAAQIPQDATQDARNRRVLLQIERADELLMTCKAEDFPALTVAKERLWNLVFPKAGVLRPRQPKSSHAPAQAAPISAAETPQEPVAVPASPT